MDDVSELIQDYLNFDDSIAKDDGANKTSGQDGQRTPPPSAAGVSETKAASALTPLLQQEMMVNLGKYKISPLDAFGFDKF